MRMQMGPLWLYLAFGDALVVCQSAAQQARWTRVDIRRDKMTVQHAHAELVCHEPRNYLAFHNPAKVRITVTAEEPMLVTLLLRGSIYGFGPIQAAYLSKRLDELHASIIACGGRVQ